MEEGIRRESPWPGPVAWTYELNSFGNRDARLPPRVPAHAEARSDGESARQGTQQAAVPGSRARTPHGRRGRRRGGEMYRTRGVDARQGKD